MSDDPRSTPERITRTWPGVPASVAEARAAVARVASAAGATEAAVAAVKVAVSEAVTNAILHAYLDAPSAGPVHVVVEHEHERSALRVKVTDEGRGMMPRPDSPGIGLGLPLIAQMTQSFEVHRGEAGGTCLEMCFTLDSDQG